MEANDRPGGVGRRRRDNLKPSLHRVYTFQVDTNVFDIGVFEGFRFANHVSLCRRDGLRSIRNDAGVFGDVGV
jgi:hypothetical protein